MICCEILAFSNKCRKTANDQRKDNRRYKTDKKSCLRPDCSALRGAWVYQYIWKCQHIGCYIYRYCIYIYIYVLLYPIAMFHCLWIACWLTIYCSLLVDCVLVILATVCINLLASRPAALRCASRANPGLRSACHHAASHHGGWPIGNRQ